MTEQWNIRTDDGLTLESEWAVPPDGTPMTRTAVLCHPHPQHGGTMRSIVISALFEALPRAGIASLRFNYRGVGASEGTYDDGIGEQRDLSAAIDALLAATGDATPCSIIGWSFGADVALARADARASSLVAITPPLRFPDRVAHLGADARPKLVILAGSDEVISNEPAIALAPTWPNTTVTEIPGASHYFIGRTQQVVDAVRGFLDGSPT